MRGWWRVRLNGGRDFVWWGQRQQGVIKHTQTHTPIHTHLSYPILRSMWTSVAPPRSTGNSCKPRLSLHGDALRADGTTGVRGHKETEGKAKLSFLLGAVIMAAPEYSRIQLNIWNLIWDSRIIFIFPWKILSISLKRPKSFQESRKPLKDWLSHSFYLEESWKWNQIFP